VANPAANEEGAHLPSLLLPPLLFFFLPSSSSFFVPKNGGGLRGVSTDFGEVGGLDPPSPLRSAPVGRLVQNSGLIM
jgi:hypothetical protein